jgi:hypothetical protein
MPIQLGRIDYTRLNARQQENFNFQKVSAVLADYGFVTMRLTDDWQGTDFIALHIDGDVLKVQLKGRFWLDKKYVGKGLYIAFPSVGHWYLYPHDAVLEIALKEMAFADTPYWKSHGVRHMKTLSQRLRQLLEPYRISGDAKPIDDPSSSSSPLELPSGSEI